MDKKLEKLTVNKRDEAAEVVEKIIDSQADEIVLSVPRFSKLTDSLSNFHLIRREAELLNKKIVIESVDDKAIELASLAKLESVNPFFAKTKRNISDITHSSRGILRKPTPLAAEETEEGTSDTEEPEEETEEEENEAEEKPLIGQPRKIRASRSAQSKRHRSRLPSFKRLMVVGGMTVVAVAFIFAANQILPRAEATIVRKKIDWNFNNTVLISRSQAAIDAQTSRIPGETFHQEKNLSLTFPASGRKKVEQSASGVITIFNAYSSDPQPLVVRTRFVAPDGKVFRLKKSVTVSGAKIVDGQIVPSSTNADVVADEPGDAYNIESVGRFSIPGFKDTPKYSAFYGQSSEAMKGGFIGEVGYPSDDDLKNAKAELRSQLDGAMTTSVMAQMPVGFKILDSAKNVTYSEPVVTGDLDQTGNFSIFGEASMTAVVFRESDFLEMFASKVLIEKGPDLEFKEHSFEYGEPRVDFTKGEMRLPVNFKGVVARKIDADELKRNLIGKSESDIKSVIFSVTGLESAKVSLWPFWVRRVPKNADKIKLIVD